MNKLEEINKMLSDAKANSLYDNFPLSKEEQAIEYLLSLIDKQREALKRLDHVLKFDYEQETFMDEALLNQCRSGTELTIRTNHIEMIKTLNWAKRFAKKVLMES